MAAVATTATLHLDDDADGGNNVDDDDNVMHVDGHACELCRSIDDEDDRRLIAREDTLNNAIAMTQTNNGDNHFPQERRERARRRAKEVHIVGRNEAGSFGT